MPAVAVRQLAPPEATPRSAAERTLQDRRLLLRYHEEGDLAARAELIERFVPLARQLARRYRSSEEPQEDLEQVAVLGLIKAIDRYEPGRGTTLSSYAVPTIVGELKRHFRDTGWSVRVPRAIQERIGKINDAVAALSTRLGHSPSLREVAQATSLTVEEVLEAKEAAPAYSTSSLDAPRPGADDEARTYADRLGQEDPRFELVELGQTIAPALRRLSHQERITLELRFRHDMTQSEIASEIGVSQMQVSRLLRRALDRLREASEGEPVGTAT